MKITISVPKPCHADWAAMTPRQQGRHCAQCDHVVADLTRATDAELVALFTSDARPKCARFDPAQLDRALTNAPPPDRTLPVAAFTTLLALASGSEALAQQPPVPPAVGGAVVRTAPAPPVRMGEAAPTCIRPLKGKALMRPSDTAHTETRALQGDTITIPEPPPPPPKPHDPQVLGGMAMERTPPEELVTGQAIRHVGPASDSVAPISRTLEGTVLDARTEEPLPFVSVQVRGTSLGASTDFDGRYRLGLPADLDTGSVTLVFHFVGYEADLLHVPKPGRTAAEPPDASGAVSYAPLREISGRVVDAVSGDAVEGAVIALNGTWARAISNDLGLFSMDRPAGCTTNEIRLRIEANGHLPQEVLMPQHGPPFADRILLDRADLDATSDPAASTSGQPTLVAMPPMHLQANTDAFVTGFIVQLQPATRWQRITAPLRRAWHTLKR